MSDQPVNIVVGVTGGIAAYKAVGVIRSLVLAGHHVQVVATEAALRFVGRPTLEAISRNPVHTDLFDEVAQVRHVAIGQAADLIVVVPATANTIARLAAGLADDLLGTTLLASAAPVLIAPAMHTEMWQHPATVANVATLRSRGVTIVGPVDGQLTGEDSGLGRMAEPDDIVATALALVGRRDLAGKRIVVTAGGTREPLDPVRFIGNRSSGKQGVALARAAALRGAAVTLIAANLEVPAPVSPAAPGMPGSIQVQRVESAAELADASRQASAGADVVIMAAAVADYRPETIAPAKVKKESLGERFSLPLVKTPDILAELCAGRSAGQVIIGFAAETEADPAKLLELGRAKLARKGSDYLVLNRVDDGRGFGTEENTIIVLAANGDIVIEATGSKAAVAGRILDLVSDA
ncbi:MAG: bifunctional phosphopantothenoylcysteine decarboxylase/phosphopantothenate--cysteine ligase CoaBC [Microbacteriaceae bacterium]